MEWIKIKIIFIIVLFIVNILLFREYIDVKFDLRQSLYTDNPISDLDIKLSNVATKYEHLEKKISELSKITAEQHYFNEESKVKKTVDEIDQTSLERSEAANRSEDVNFMLTKDVDKGNYVDLSKSAQQIEKNIANLINISSKYRFSNYDNEEKKIIFYQVYDGVPFYEIENARLTVSLDRDNQVISYTQSELINFKEIENDIPHMSLLDVLKAVFNKEKLITNDEVTDIAIGYFSLVSSHYIYEPTWKITINSYKVYYVAPVNGDIY